jgi:beta-1,4-mannosyl-glycoprotein beta-1,4-N-acetylglucosaminyltransferase
MKPKEISKKIEDMAHTEFNKEKFKDINSIENNIKNLKDPFNRDLNLKKTEIDETYPEFIQKNKEQYQEWILQ